MIYRLVAVRREDGKTITRNNANLGHLVGIAKYWLERTLVLSAHIEVNDLAGPVGPDGISPWRPLPRTLEELHDYKP